MPEYASASGIFRHCLSRFPEKINRHQVFSPLCEQLE